MPKNKVYIIEDMAANRLSLELLIEDHDMEVIGSAASGEVAVEQLSDLTPDILLVDINLGSGINGLQVVERVRESMSVAVVFLTAYGDKATLEKVRELDADGYVMKPYNAPTLLTTIDIALSRNLKKETASHLTIKDGYQTYRIRINDINYIQSDANYLQIYCSDQRYHTRQKLNDFHALLPGEKFIRVHQRTIINLDHVKRFDPQTVAIMDVEIPISRSYKSSFKEALVSYRK